MSEIESRLIVRNCECVEMAIRPLALKSYFMCAKNTMYNYMCDSTVGFPSPPPPPPKKKKCSACAHTCDCLGSNTLMVGHDLRSNGTCTRTILHYLMNRNSLRHFIWPNFKVLLISVAYKMSSIFVWFNYVCSHGRLQKFL